MPSDAAASPGFRRQAGLATPFTGVERFNGETALVAAAHFFVPATADDRKRSLNGGGERCSLIQHRLRRT